MPDFREYIGVDFTSQFLQHYGVGHLNGGHSGRYPWGSGKRPKQDHSDDSDASNAILSPKHSDSLHKSAIAAGFRPLKEQESLETSLKKTNPYRGEYEGRYNCLSCALSGYLRTSGIEAEAKGRLSNSGVSNGPEILESISRGKKVDSITLDKGEDPRVATQAIKDLYGDNASGLIAVCWKGGGGHVYNFDTTGGKVQYIDYQSGHRGKDVECYFDHVDPNMQIHLFRLDNTELDMKRMTKYVDS